METAPEVAVDTVLGAAMEIVEYVCASILTVSLSLVLTLHLKFPWKLIFSLRSVVEIVVEVAMETVPWRSCHGDRPIDMETVAAEPFLS